MGFIDFTNGEVLTADQMDLVMRQGIMRFADASARDTALSEVLAEGMMAYLDDTNEVLKYDGTSWIDISGDITGVTAGTALTGGGTSGNVTLDVDESALTISQSQVTDLVTDLADKQDDVITTQGDLVIGDPSGNPVRLPVGTADQVLTSDGTTVSFQDAGGGGAGELYAAGSHTVSKDSAYYLIEISGNGLFKTENQVLQNGINNISSFTELGVSLQAGVNWTSKTSNTTEGLQGVGFGDNLFVAVGLNGEIVTSPDGITWTSRSSGSSAVLIGVSYGNDLFVVVGSSGEILSSPDGITWTSRSSGSAENLQSIVFNNELFLVVGNNGEILTSPDGITWTSRTSGTSQTLRSVAKTVGVFVVVGFSGEILTSPDGITWTSRTSGTAESLFGTTYGNDLFVAVGNNGEIVTSPEEISDPDAVLLISELPSPIEP